MGQPFNEYVFINRGVYSLMILKNSIFSLGYVVACVFLQGKKGYFFFAFFIVSDVDIRILSEYNFLFNS